MELDKLLGEQKVLLQQVAKGDVTLDVALALFDTWASKVEDYAHERYLDGMYDERDAQFQ